MMLFRKSVLFLLFAFMLSSCTTVEVKTATPEHERLWQQHLASLTRMGPWSLSGRAVALVDDSSWHVNLRWSQDAGDADIYLSGPFNQGGVHVSVQEEGYAELQTDKGETFIGHDVESLLYQQLGWAVPVRGFRYWMLGMPHPEHHAEGRELDELGRLRKLTQLGWALDYRAYKDLPNGSLPRKLYLTQGDLKLKLVVQEWRI